MTPIETALRNSTVLRWWGDCQPGFRSAVRQFYARHLGCPDCELGNAETFSQDPDVLDWLATCYAGTISLWEEDRL